MHDDDRLIQELRDVFADRRRDRFAAGFADRTVARWRATGGARHTLRDALDAAFARQFRRIGLVAAAAVLLLAAYNLHRRERVLHQSFVEALLGVTPAGPVMIDELYGLDASPRAGG